MFAAAFADHALDFAFGDQDSLSNADGTDAFGLDEPAYRELGYPDPARSFVNPVEPFLYL
jgi:hypothetical protein